MHNRRAFTDPTGDRAVARAARGADPTREALAQCAECHAIGSATIGRRGRIIYTDLVTVAPKRQGRARRHACGGALVAHDVSVAAGRRAAT